MRRCSDARPQMERWRRGRCWIGRSVVATLAVACAFLVGPGPVHAGPQAPLVTNAAGAGVPSVGQSPPLVVAVDPGHGGSNLGAPTPARGIYEKHVTLALARRIAALLAGPATPQLPVRVVLCRDSDDLVPIRARSRCAADSGARLFLSLHANAVPPDVPAGSRRGFEVFVLGPQEVEEDAALAALAERADADAVWAAHEVRAAAEQSILLGRTLARHLGRTIVPASGRGVRQSGAALDVLRGSGTAAALVEIGFLDHPQEGPRLITAEGREPIAVALAGAIRAYLCQALESSDQRACADNFDGGSRDETESLAAGGGASDIGGSRAAGGRPRPGPSARRRTTAP